MSPKYALVTGASSGIGYNLAIELSKKVIKSLDVPHNWFYLVKTFGTRIWCHISPIRRHRY